ncbi:MAG: short-chain dehydrogenase [Chloroflexota bacterium]|nr:MAG: short-chain dehydrogenase [Chloroflexota bacterium]
MGKLQGQVAIVTGGSAGIGRATAKLFAAEGARVVIAARRSEKIGSVAGEIVKEGGECMAVPADVAKRQQVEHLVQVTLARYGRIDILLNNAGVLPLPVVLAEMAETEWDEVFTINTKSIYYTVRSVWPAMVEQGGGVIVNTASVVAFRGTAGLAAYCATKAAIVMLTKSLALEGAPLGIRVNCVCPGFIDTPMNKWLGSLQPDQEVWLKDMLERIPLHRAGNPEEIARASLFLASADSSYMTGQSVILDGGVLA